MWHFVNGVPQIGAVTITTLNIGADVSLSRGAANRLDLATGDSFYLVSGGLGVGVAPPAAGILKANLYASLGGLSVTGANAEGGTVDQARLGFSGGKSFFNSSVTPSADAPLSFGVSNLQLKDVLFISATAPTIASGFGTSPSIVASNGTAAFTVNVGTGGSASSGVITMPAATTGWIAHVENLTGVLGNYANQRTVQIASTTTSVTLENQTISTGAALAWTASDVLVVTCIGY